MSWTLKDSHDALLHQVKQLESALAAEQEARKQLSEEYASLQQSYSDVWQRAEAAEALIKASREQEPVAWFNARCAGNYEWNSKYASSKCPKLYAQPQIPPDVAEPQRQLEEMLQDWEKYHAKWIKDAAWHIGKSELSFDEKRIAFFAVRDFVEDIKAIVSAAPATDQPKE